MYRFFATAAGNRDGFTVRRDQASDYIAPMDPAWHVNHDGDLAGPSARVPFPTRVGETRPTDAVNVHWLTQCCHQKLRLFDLENCLLKSERHVFSESYFTQMKCEPPYRYPSTLWADVHLNRILNQARLTCGDCVLGLDTSRDRDPIALDVRHHHYLHRSRMTHPVTCTRRTDSVTDS